jgi:hypothetical protein
MLDAWDECINPSHQAAPPSPAEPKTGLQLKPKRQCPKAKDYSTYRPRSVNSLLIRFSAIVYVLGVRCGWVFGVIVCDGRKEETETFAWLFKEDQTVSCQRGMTRKGTEPVGPVNQAAL